MLAGMSRDRDHEAPPAPEPLAVPVPDSHTHLDIVVGVAGDGSDADGESDTRGEHDERGYAARVVEQIEAARLVGVDRVVQVGVDLTSSRWSARLAREHAGVLAAVALHPNEAPALCKSGELDEALRVIEGLARKAGRAGVRVFIAGLKPEMRRLLEAHELHAPRVTYTATANAALVEIARSRAKD